MKALLQTYGLGLGLAAVLLGGYLWLWQPTRQWIAQRVAYPALAALSAERAQGY